MMDEMDIDSRPSHSTNNSNSNSACDSVAVIEFLRKHGLSEAVEELKKKLHDEEKGNIPSQNKSTNNSDIKNVQEQTTEPSCSSNNNSNNITNVLDEIPTAKQKRYMTDFNRATGGGLGYDLSALPYTKVSPNPNVDTNVQILPAGISPSQYMDSFNAIQIWVLNLPDELYNHYEKNFPNALQNNKKRNKNNSTTMNVNVHESCKAELLAVCFPMLVHSYCDLLENRHEDEARSLWQKWKNLYQPLYSQECLDLDNCSTFAKLEEMKKHIYEFSKLQYFTTKLNQIKQDRNDKIAKRDKIVAQTPSSTTPPVPNVEVDRLSQSIKQLDSQSAKYKEKLELLKAKGNLTQKLNLFPFLKRARSKKYTVLLSGISWNLLCEFIQRDRIAPMFSILQERLHVVVEARDPLPFTPPSIIHNIYNNSDEEDHLVMDDDSIENNRNNVIKNEEGSTNAQSNKKQKIHQPKPIKWAAPIHPSSRAAELGGPTNLLNNLPFPNYYLPPTKDEDKAKRESLSRDVEFNRALRINGFRRLEALETKEEYESGMRVPQYSFFQESSNNNSKQSKRYAFAPYHSSVVAGSISKRVPSALSNEDIVDPHSPSVLMATCASGKTLTLNSLETMGHAHSLSSSDNNNNNAATHKKQQITTKLEQDGIGITCASFSPLDGRRAAVGCEDSLIRVWSMNNDSNNGSGEAEIILVGHKKGSPVFDVSWNRDGRHLLSAAGDGSVRLWDTKAVGPFTSVVDKKQLSKFKNNNNNNGQTQVQQQQIDNSQDTTTSQLTTPKTLSDFYNLNTDIPGTKSPSHMVPLTGAAIAVYNGHTSGTPVWSCEFSPSGYYFASCGADFTGRIWTTDRPAPQRILAGHVAPLNTIAWHPNCNYVLTGSDDCTMRMWDVQTGICVRILSGCYAPVTTCQVSPSGRFVAGADLSGVIGIWDLDSGRKVNEFRSSSSSGQIHSLSYSSCGTSLASGGEDCSVKIWDVRGISQNTCNPDVAVVNDYLGEYGQVKRTGTSKVWEMPGTKTPERVYRTRKTMILDLKYTKRNLLMCFGKYIG